MTSKAHITPDVASSVIKGEMFAGVTCLAFRDPSLFRAAELHRHTDLWVEFSSILLTIPQTSKCGIIISTALSSFSLIIKEAIKGLIRKITIFSIVIGLNNSYFPLIHLPSCCRTVCYGTVQ